MIIRAHFADAVQIGDAVFFDLELAQDVSFNSVMPFVADADFLVVFDVFIPVALGVDVDLFGAFFVFDAEFVVALAARGAEGFEGAAGLVGRQVVGDEVGALTSPRAIRHAERLDVFFGII